MLINFTGQKLFGFDFSRLNFIFNNRAITELQNTAIKDRHWLELMKSTGVCDILFDFSITLINRFIYPLLAVLKIWHDLFGNTRIMI